MLVLASNGFSAFFSLQHKKKQNTKRITKLNPSKKDEKKMYIYRVAQKKRPTWLDHNCSHKFQYFFTKLHTQFVQYLLMTVMQFECDINKTVEMVLIVKQQIFGLLCCFALHYLDEGC